MRKNGSYLFSSAKEFGFPDKCLIEKGRQDKRNRNISSYHKLMI